ncbi:MAG: phosphoribosylglycinamide formyltransferase [Methylocystis sp.]|nr:phosphoribosylglycinamide formyltransferase [Methylocystis sp.]MCA3584488.1 phosphoribosylglycinamide formyltransferase [Methylocystis sp.]MCA3588029.1 phosphoribosylglycinamide formyltransferase [Methylocystis sp.]MCA3590490.1 phosphoribosylglycinamide formyltransferase [Methylocystis sp.]
MTAAPDRKRAAILISGRGSNMAALIEAAKAPAYPASIALVISNNPEAAGLGHARAEGIPTVALSHKNFPDRESFDRAVHAELEEKAIDLVALAGFMRVLSPWFCRQWEGRLLNIHPSLLPKFKGVDTHRRALEAGEAEHGCTVHVVTPDLDDGPIILQARVPVLPDDTTDSLAARVLAEEHRIYPLALAKAAGG